MIKLELGALSLDLDDCTSGLEVTKFDPGYPAVREVSNNAADRDGAIDQTQLFGPRVISLDGILKPTDAISKVGLLQKLMPFMQASARPMLTWQLYPQDDPLQAQVRPAQLSQALTPMWSDTFSAQWVAADPKWYSSSQQTVTISLAAAGVEGRTYNLVFNRTYPLTGGGEGVVLVQVGGSVPTPPTFRIYGYCVNPRVINQTTGEQLSFIGTVDPGDYLLVDVGQRLVLLNSDPAASRYSMLDYLNSSWWLLQPGPNQVRYTADAVQVQSQVEMTWRNASL